MYFPSSLKKYLNRHFLHPTKIQKPVLTEQTHRLDGRVMFLCDLITFIRLVPGQLVAGFLLAKNQQQDYTAVLTMSSRSSGRLSGCHQHTGVSLFSEFWFKPGRVVQVLVLRLRDSVVRLGEELEQSAQAEARERENACYYQQRLQDMRIEMEELTHREEESSRKRLELVNTFTNTFSFTAV